MQSSLVTQRDTQIVVMLRIMRESCNEDKNNLSLFSKNVYSSDINHSKTKLFNLLVTRDYYKAHHFITYDLFLD